MQIVRDNPVACNLFSRFLYNSNFTMDIGKVPSAKGRAAAIVSKPDKPELASIVPELIEWFGRYQYQVVVDHETASYAVGVDILGRDEMASRPLDFVVVLGGDGTLLSAARCMAKAGIPVLGVNLGSLGFLTEVPLEELYPTLKGIEEGRCNVETRSMVHCQVLRKDSPVASYDALNDIVVGKGTVSRLNHCDVYIDGAFVSVYKADSLIVSTPTGSTAYSLAAGGAVLSPNAQALTITPVCPHTLSNRSVIVAMDSVIEVKNLSERLEVFLSADGQVQLPLTVGDVVRIERAQETIRLVRLPGGSFFQTLRNKLNWSGSSVKG